MTTEPEPTTDDPTLKVARDLTAIAELADDLEAEAFHAANSRDLPGGAAMVALGPVASHEAFLNVFDTNERIGRDTTYMRDDDDEWEPPLQTLRYWSEPIRTAHGSDYEMRHTTASEAAYLHGALDWIVAHEPRWDDFARDVNRARRRLEDVLHAGRRAQRVRVSCDADDCERKPRLIKVYGPDPADDHHKCPACKRRYDDDAFSRAYARQLRSAGAERFVRVADAVGVLRAQGRSERTIRKWFAECQVEGKCDPVTHEVWCWWPDLWRLHLTTPTRERRSSS